MEKIKVSVIEDKLQKIKIELIHEGYLDGWYIQYLKEKKATLEELLVMKTRELS